MQNSGELTASLWPKYRSQGPVFLYGVNLCPIWIIIAILEKNVPNTEEMCNPKYEKSANFGP